MKRLLALPLLLGACAQLPGQNQYDWNDVGKATPVEFCKVIASRDVGITGRNTGGAAAVGMVAGAGAGSYIGNGTGSLWGALGGAIAGAVIANAAEQAAADRQGIEYTVTTHDGMTLTIVQNAKEGEARLKDGSRCMLQTSGGYQRVLPATGMPTKVKRPKKIAVE